METKISIKSVMIGLVSTALLGGVIFTGTQFISKKDTIAENQIQNAVSEPQIQVETVVVATSSESVLLQEKSATVTPEVVAVKKVPTPEEIKAKEALQKAQAEIDLLKSENVVLNGAKVVADEDAKVVKQETIEVLEIIIAGYIEVKDAIEEWVTTIDQITECIYVNGTDNDEEIAYFEGLGKKVLEFKMTTNAHTDAVRAQRIVFEQKPLSFYYDFEAEQWADAETELMEKNLEPVSEWFDKLQSNIDRNLKTCEQ